MLGWPSQLNVRIPTPPFFPRGFTRLPRRPVPSLPHGSPHCHTVPRTATLFPALPRRPVPARGAPAAGQHVPRDRRGPGGDAAPVVGASQPEARVRRVRRAGGDDSQVGLGWGGRVGRGLVELGLVGHYGCLYLTAL